MRYNKSKEKLSIKDFISQKSLSKSLEMSRLAAYPFTYIKVTQ